MTSVPNLLAVALATAVLVLPAGAAWAAPDYTNCTNLQRTYPNGIGRTSAVDRVAAGSRPVTTFTRDTRGYDAAMRVNRGLDRDRDGIACEKR